jgi:hypothetical protein
LFVVLAVLVLTHPIILVFVISLVLFLLLLKLEGFKIETLDYEVLLFVGFLVIWILFMIYKNAFVFHGPSVIWQNLPSNLLAGYFKDLTYLEMIYFVGFIPLFFGVIGLYHVLFRQKRKAHVLIVAFVAAFFFLLFFRLLPLEVGLAFLSLFLIVLAGNALSELSRYISQTRFSWITVPFFIIVLLLFLLTSVLQAFSLGLDTAKNSPSAGDVDALQALGAMAQPNATVLVPIEEGFLVNYYTGLKTVADNNFLLIPDVNVRFNDTRTLFTARLETGALRLLDTYHVDYLFLSDHYFTLYAVRPPYLADDKCFELLYNQSQQFYRVRCRLA